MSTFTEYTTLQYTTIKCCTCGVFFAMETRHQERRISDGNSFFCPNGHSQSFTESTEEKLRKTAEQLQAARTQLSANREQLAASETRIERLRKRVSSGVCPCCHRTFKQLSEHMKNKHPSYPTK